MSGHIDVDHMVVVLASVNVTLNAVALIISSHPHFASLAFVIGGVLTLGLSGLVSARALHRRRRDEKEIDHDVDLVYGAIQGSGRPHLRVVRRENREM